MQQAKKILIGAETYPPDVNGAHIWAPPSDLYAQARARSTRGCRKSQPWT